MANVAEVIFSVPSNFVQLDMGCIEDDCHLKRSTLTPANGDLLTLLVANVPVPRMSDPEHMRYFRFLANKKTENADIFLPYKTDKSIPWDHIAEECNNPPGLSADQVALANLFLRLGFVAFENKPECSPVIFRN